jgi:hypothetical protein
MDASDPLARLAIELERLSAANLALSEATERLAAPEASERAALRGAAAEARRAARAAAEASARLGSAS